MMPLGTEKKRTQVKKKLASYQIIKSTGCTGVSEQLKYCILWALLSIPSDSVLHGYKMIVE